MRGFACHGLGARRRRAPDAITPSLRTAQATGTISRPNGNSETGISLKFASPSGIPMIVTHSATPVTRCSRASHQPHRTSHRTLPIVRAGSRPGLPDDRAAEWPQGVHADPQRGDTKRNRDDQDEADQGGQQVAQEQPEAREHEPDDVEQEPQHREAQPPSRRTRSSTLATAVT